jgi:hypothetical protein
MTHHPHASSLLTKIAFSFVFLAAIGLCLKNFSPYCLADDPKPLMAYVGTFSSPLKDTLPTQVDLPPGNGRGIHLFRIDRKSGALEPAGIYEMGNSPSCLAVNVDGTRLYSANETDRVGNQKHGTVSSFSIDPIDGKLTLLNTVPSGGEGPTYVSIHPSKQFLLVANYFGGSVSVLPILPDGKLGEATDVKQDAGTIGPTISVSTRFSFGSSTQHKENYPRTTQHLSRSRQAMARDISTSIPTVESSIPFKKKVLLLPLSITTPSKER